MPFYRGFISAKSGSNRRPSELQSDALSTELLAGPSARTRKIKNYHRRVAHAHFKFKNLSNLSHAHSKFHKQNHDAPRDYPFDKNETMAPQLKQWLRI